jgi:hypothetical protein
MLWLKQGAIESAVNNLLLLVDVCDELDERQTAV